MLIFVVAVGCVTTKSRVTETFDRAITVTTLDMFAQTDSVKGGKPWLGDWEFRRDRLDLLDSALRDLRPDVAVFQNSVRRSGSVSEDDRLILQAGSLSRHEWVDTPIESISESGETRSLAVSTLRPSSVELASLGKEMAYWVMGADGHLAVFRLVGFGETILVANVLMPSRLDQVGLWYSFVKDRLLEATTAGQGCRERLVVAGYLPVDIDNRKAAEFTKALDLKDTAMGFCQNAQRCQTTTISNGIYAATRGDQGSGQMDRILVSSRTQVIAASLSYTASRESERYREQYHLNSIWPSQRFGWTAKLRLPGCATH